MIDGQANNVKDDCQCRKSTERIPQWPSYGKHIHAQVVLDRVIFTKSRIQMANIVVKSRDISPHPNQY